MPDYKHGTYGEIVGSIGGKAASGSTIPVYVGSAPAYQVPNGDKYVDTPILLHSMEDVYKYFGYLDDPESWYDYDLCGAFWAHFKNPMGNVGPIVAINVHKLNMEAEPSELNFTFVDGKFSFKKAAIVDTVIVDGKTKGVDYTVEYDHDHEQITIKAIGDALLDGEFTLSYKTDNVLGSPTLAVDVIGTSDTDTGTYTGLGCVSQIYPKFGLIPNIIVCPKFGIDANVYKAMIKAATKINGHWDAMVYADLPVFDEDGVEVNGTIAEAIAYKAEYGYIDERSKVFWPYATTTDGHLMSLSVLAAWATVATDAANDGVPMESPSNKALPIVAHQFALQSKNNGFDVQGANKLNAAGITTCVFWGGRWVLWGPHTAAYKHGADNDGRVIFDNSMRMMFHVSNSFQNDWAVSIDKPMTRALADTIKAREQEKMDAWARMGAFIGEPVVEFRETANSSGDILEGNFTWHTKGTTTPPFKSGTLKIAHTTEGYESFFGGVV